MLLTPPPQKNIYKRCTLILLVLFVLLPMKGNSQVFSKRFVFLKTNVENHFKKTENEELLKAASFVLDNIYYHKYYYSKQIEELGQSIDSINKTNKNYPSNFFAIKNKIDTFYSDYELPQKMRLYESISSSQLIKDIEYSYKTWKNSPFASHISFNEYCEYLLPPVIGECPYSDWRKEYKQGYQKLLKSLSLSSDRRHSAYWAVCAINYQLRRGDFRVKLLELPFGLNYTANHYLNLTCGTCKDFAYRTAYVMRACGIPVGIDFTPQWPNRNGGHYWNTLLSENGKIKPFTGGGNDPGTPFYEEAPFAKVYRLTFERQMNSLPVQVGMSRVSVPEILNNAFIKDVTDEYVSTVNITMNIKPDISCGKFLYLAVWDNTKWVPVDFSKITDGKFVFYKIGKNVVVMPGFWKDGTLVGKFNPIKIHRDGKMTVLKPNYSKKIDLEIDRKYPLFQRILDYSNRMSGGIIEASNDSDFSKFVVAGNIITPPIAKTDTVRLTAGNNKYRYWRYHSPNGGYCDIAELSFVNDGKIVVGSRLIADTFRTEGMYKPQNAVDGKFVTFYESTRKNGGWIGFDFGHPITLDMFVYTPRNDDNGISPGDDYELEILDDGEWVSLDKQKACSNSLTFRNIPSGGLYILHDRTKGHEERIFTYDNGDINWY